MSSARRDCSSNVISTTTVLVTPAASYVSFQPLKNSLTRYSTFISTVTDFATIHSTNIIESTISTTILTSTETTEIDSQSFTEYSTSTATVISTFYASTTPYVSATRVVTLSLPGSTVTSYTPTTAGPSVTAPAKRDLGERAASVSPTIPAYASACKNFGDYAQACSAAGVIPGTSTAYSTLPAITITVVDLTTSFATNYATSTTEIDVQITQTSTIVSTTTLSTTITLPATTSVFETAFVTSTAAAVTSVSYSVTTVYGPVSTVTVPVPTFILKMVPVAGGTPLYMQNKPGDGVVSLGTTDITQATTYTIDTLNRLITVVADPQISCESHDIANYYINNVRASFLNNKPSYQTLFQPLNCRMNADLTVTCTYKTASAFTLYNNQFFYSTPNYNNYPTYVAHAIPIPS